MIEAAIRQVKAEIHQYSETLVSGTVSDYAEYRALAGHIAGLQRALMIMEELLARSEKDPD